MRTPSVRGTEKVCITRVALVFVVCPQVWAVACRHIREIRVSCRIVSAVVNDREQFRRIRNTPVAFAAVIGTVEFIAVGISVCPGIGA